MKQVRETKAGKSVSAWVVLKRHRHIATIQAHYSDGGTVIVNVFNHGKNRSAEKLPFQSGHAGGYGYDKFTAALAGLEIDGHKLTNHCQVNRKPKTGLYSREATAPRGFQFANFTHKKWNGDKEIELPVDQCGYADCYREPGLKFLEAVGYQVISAI